MDGKRYQIIGVHVAGWVLFVHWIFNIPGLIGSFMHNVAGGKEFDEALILVPLMLSLFYLNSEVLIPRFLLKKNGWFYLLSLLLCLFFFAAVGGGLTALMIAIGLEPNMTPISFVEDTNGFFLLAIGVSGSFALARQHARNERRKKELKQYQLEAEMKLLKAQADPHFMFNALNTLFAMAQEEEATQTERGLLILSDIMRYHIMEASAAKVALEDELTFIENYIAFQQLRIAGQIEVLYKREGEANGLEVIPMLLIPFVENAFKHGISYRTKTPISIQLEIKEGQLMFNVSNGKQDLLGSPHSLSTGLENIIKRLDLMYENKYQLTIDDTEHNFEIKLQVNLT